jgi:AcrR family transcriptional regulator
METRTSDVRRLSSNERREQLLRVASELFARTGYDATTMDQVAAAAGVTKPLLYQHFESKHALYEELVTTAATRLLDRLAVAASPDAAPREKVERGLDAFFSTLLSDDASFRLLLMPSSDEDITRHLDAVEHSIIEFVDPLIDAGLDDDHRRLLAAAVVGMAKSAVTYWLEADGASSPNDRRVAAERLARRCAQLVWGGLRSVGPA